MIDTSKWIDTTLIVLKFLAIAVSGIAGVIAIVGETRDKAGRVTRWGKVMLGGIILSATVAAAIEVEQLIKQRNDADESARREKETVQTLQSPLMPQARMSVSFEMRVTLSHPRLAAYRDRVYRLLSPALTTKVVPKPLPNSNWEFKPEGDTTRLSGVRFGPESPFYPQPADGQNLPEVFDHFGIEVHIIDVPTRKGFWFYAFPMDGKREYRIEPSDDTLTFTVDNVELVPGKNWNSDGTIISLPQLIGKKMEIDFIGFDWGNDPQIDLGIELKQVSRIGYFEFFAANRKFLLGTSGQLGKPIVYVFPTNFLNGEVNLPEGPSESTTINLN